MCQPPQDAIDNNPSRPPQPRSTRKVLLVEDSPEFQYLMQRILTNAGAEVTTDGDGQAALQRIERAANQESCFDVIVTDLQMPILDGIEMTRQLRKRGCTIPIVMYTATSDPSVPQRAREAGCDCFLDKAISLGEIVAQVLHYADDQAHRSSTHRGTFVQRGIESADRLND